MIRQVFIICYYFHTYLLIITLFIQLKLEQSSVEYLTYETLSYGNVSIKEN